MYKSKEGTSCSWTQSSDASWRWMKGVYLRVGGELLGAIHWELEQMFLPTLIPLFPELKD